MKTKPALDEAKFLAGPSILVTLCGQPVEAKPRKFKTGSLGYYANGKVTQVVDGQVVKLQVGANITICGTKPEDEAAE